MVSRGACQILFVLLSEITSFKVLSSGSCLKHIPQTSGAGVGISRMISPNSLTSEMLPPKVPFPAPLRSDLRRTGPISGMRRYDNWLWLRVLCAGVKREFDLPTFDREASDGILSSPRNIEHTAVPQQAGRPITTSEVVPHLQKSKIRKAQRCTQKVSKMQCKKTCPSFLPGPHLN